jgi:protein-S-isoprenylcysteine O-methyltransferase Ste14
MTMTDGRRIEAARKSLRERLADLVLFTLTAVELALLLRFVPSFTITDWIYVTSHLIVLGIALTRRPAKALDRALTSYAAVIVAYAYPYAQVVYMRWVSGNPVWPAGGVVLVAFAAVLSLVSLVALGRGFGLRPALRELTTTGPYRVVRHPIYLAYVIADIGYNLQEWNLGTILLVLAGWAAMIYRIHAEESILSRDPGWQRYVSSVRSRLVPGIW